MRCPTLEQVALVGGVVVFMAAIAGARALAIHLAGRDVREADRKRGKGRPPAAPPAE